MRPPPMGEITFTFDRGIKRPRRSIENSRPVRHVSVPVVSVTDARRQRQCLVIVSMRHGRCYTEAKWKKHVKNLYYDDSTLP